LRFKVGRVGLPDARHENVAVTDSAAAARIDERHDSRLFDHLVALDQVEDQLFQQICTPEPNMTLVDRWHPLNVKGALTAIVKFADAQQDAGQHVSLLTGRLEVVVPDGQSYRVVLLRYARRVHALHGDVVDGVQHLLHFLKGRRLH